MISFTVMCSMLFAMVSVFAVQKTVTDNYFYRTGNYDNGYTLFSGTFDTSTNRLSNVTSSKAQYGDVTITLSSIERTQQTASMTSRYYRDGVYKQKYDHFLPND